MMAALYDVSIPAINQHLKRIISDNELDEEAVVKHYSQQAIISVGFKIENIERPTLKVEVKRKAAWRRRCGA
jgi:hypothetical protein